MSFDPSLPHAFTEHGASMAANVLNFARAVEVIVFVVRTFVKLRRPAPRALPGITWFRSTETNMVYFAPNNQLKRLNRTRLAPSQKGRSGVEALLTSATI